eukprot:gene224-biopygen12079
MTFVATQPTLAAVWTSFVRRALLRCRRALLRRRRFCCVVDGFRGDVDEDCQGGLYGMGGGGTMVQRPALAGTSTRYLQKSPEEYRGILENHGDFRRGDWILPPGDGTAEKRDLSAQILCPQRRKKTILAQRKKRALCAEQCDLSAGPRPMHCVPPTTVTPVYFCFFQAGDVINVYGVFLSSRQ